MHAKDRTLIASLGFQDKDKKNDRHDLACRFFTLPEVTGSLVALHHRSRTTAESTECVREQHEMGRGDVKTWRRTSSTHTPQAGAGTTEFVLTKGENQYKVTLGFLDVVVPVEVVTAEVGVEWQTVKGWVFGKGDVKESTPEKPCQFKYARDDGALIIEVKIEPESLGNVIRQIKFYREHWTEWRGEATWILATDYDVSSRDAETLLAEGIHHIRLGERFEEYVRQSRASPVSSSVVF